MFKFQVKNHVIRYIFRLGDRMKILSIPQMNITDGKYHIVVVKREGNYASMQIDYDGLVAGNTGGVHKLLNMGGGSFFTGGLPNITEVRVIEAIVQSGGNAILRTADGRVLTSGIGSGRSGTSFGSGMASTLITITSTEKLVVHDFIDSQAIFVSGHGARSVAIESIDDGKVSLKVGTLS
jgi:protocadherin Fat 1/2/3